MAEAVPTPPPHPVLPSARWLMSVYVRDSQTRQHEYLAAITSVFGRVLEMDSTGKARLRMVFLRSDQWSMV